LGDRHEKVLAALHLLRARFARRVRDGELERRMTIEERPDERGLAGPGRGGDDIQPTTAGPRTVPLPIGRLEHCTGGSSARTALSFDPRLLHLPRDPLTDVRHRLAAGARVRSEDRTSAVVGVKAPLIPSTVGRSSGKYATEGLHHPSRPRY